MVREIKELGPELELELFANLEILEEREIHVCLFCCLDGISACVAKGANNSRLEGVRIDPIVGSLILWNPRNAGNHIGPVLAIGV